jgi:hypothetical protein
LTNHACARHLVLQGQIWILVQNANDIKLDFGATDLVLFVCCDVLFNDFRGMGGVDVGEEMGRGDELYVRRLQE